MQASFSETLSYPSLSVQVFLGFSISEGTSGTSTGTSRLKSESCSYATLSNAPDRAAVTIARLCFIFILCPTPYGPPDQPVFTRYTTALYRLIFSPNNLAYTDARRGINGAPKHSEKTDFGSFMPRSVPASLLVYPDIKWYMAPSFVRRDTGGNTPKASAVRNIMAFGFPPRLGITTFGM